MAFLKIPVDDPRYPIFKEIYEVNVPSLAIRSLKDIERNGIYLNGDPASDNTILNERKTIYIPIAKIARAVDLDIDIRFPKVDEMVKMYQVTQTYLEKWREVIRTTYHEQAIPSNELSVLETFNSRLYVEIRDRMDTDAFRDTLGGNLRDSVSFDMADMRTRIKRATMPEEERKALEAQDLEDKILAERESFGDLFNTLRERQHRLASAREDN